MKNMAYILRRDDDVAEARINPTPELTSTAARGEITEVHNGGYAS